VVAFGEIFVGGGGVSFRGGVSGGRCEFGFEL